MAALLLAADADPVAPPWHASALAEALPHSRLHILPGLAHGFPEQAAGAYAAFVTSFLGDVAAANRTWAIDTTL